MFILSIGIYANALASTPAETSFLFGYDLPKIEVTEDFKSFIQANAEAIDASAPSLSFNAQELSALLTSVTASPTLSEEFRDFDLQLSFGDVTVGSSGALNVTNLANSTNDLFDAIKNFANTNTNSNFEFGAFIDVGDQNEVDLLIFGNSTEGSRQIPIDGGLSFLALGGIAFGVSRFRSKK